MLLHPAILMQFPKVCWKKRDKQIRVGVSRTDIDSILAELYEKGITKPSAEQLVESEERDKEKVQVCQRKVWGAHDVYRS